MKQHGAKMEWLLSQDMGRVSNHVPADTEQDCVYEAQPQAHQ